MLRNPEAQEKLREEVQSLSKVPTPAELGKMKYFQVCAYFKCDNFLIVAQACLRESFRLTPTVFTNARVLPEDIVLRGYQIPANTLCLLVYDVIHKDPRYFPEPLVFRPERWLDDKVERKIPPYSVSVNESLTHSHN